MQSSSSANGKNLANGAANGGGSAGEHNNGTAENGGDRSAGGVQRNNNVRDAELGGGGNGERLRAVTELLFRERVTLLLGALLATNFAHLLVMLFVLMSRR